MSINDLSAIDALAAGDLIPVYDASNGDTRKISASSLSDYVETSIVDKFPEYTVQRSSPSATGFSVTISSTDGTSIHLILTPVAGYAAGTIVLPAAATCVDKQEVLVNCTQIVTTLTISENGASHVTGEPTTLAANAFFRLRYDLTTLGWYRVG